MLKRPNAFLSSYTGIFYPYYINIDLLNRSNHSDPRIRPSKRSTDIGYKRYAYTSSAKAALGESDPFHWPDTRHPRIPLTPYEILSTKQSATYSKRRFYELVKVYHPDRNGHADGKFVGGEPSGAVKMERYCLIVTAHEILSDPAKRKAYDTTGAGWNGHPEHGIPRYDWGQHNGKQWTGFDRNDSPFRCATWEDWEKWYMRDKAKQEPVYISNGGFLVLVIAVVFLGGFGQSIRVEDYYNVFQRQVERVHDDASKALRSRKTESMGFGNRDERLHNFLKTRDPIAYGVTDLSEESYRKLLPDPEVCMSESTHHQGAIGKEHHDSGT